MRTTPPNIAPAGRGEPEPEAETRAPMGRRLSRALLGAVLALGIALVVGAMLVSIAASLLWSEPWSSFLNRLILLMYVGVYFAVPAALIGVVTWWLVEARAPASMRAAVVAGLCVGVAGGVLHPPAILATAPAGAIGQCWPAVG